MFGDDPDITVMTVLVGSGITFGRVREECRGLTREVRLELVGCAEGLELRRREERGARRQFPETENVRR